MKVNPISFKKLKINSSFKILSKSKTERSYNKFLKQNSERNSSFNSNKIPKIHSDTLE